MTPKVLLVDSNHEILHNTLQTAGISCDCFWNRTTDELLNILPNYEAVVIRSRFKFDKSLIDQLPKLRCIGRVGAGMENIDVAYAESKGIQCLCVPEGNRDAVAEHAIGMLLMLLNNLAKADSEVRQGIWLRAENRGIEITGKTVGVIGYGNMGSAFAQKLSGFGCTILAHDKYKSIKPDNAIKQVDLEQLYREADIVSLHLPLTAETHYYAGESFFNGFSKPIYFINTARGKCTDTSALVNAIKNGKVKGACIDVLEYESLSFEGIPVSSMPAPLQFLIQSDKVILSPHIAGWTHESNYKMSKLIAEKMIKVLKT